MPCAARACRRRATASSTSRLAFSASSTSWVNTGSSNCFHHWVSSAGPAVGTEVCAAEVFRHAGPTGGRIGMRRVIIGSNHAAACRQNDPAADREQAPGRNKHPRSFFITACPIHSEAPRSDRVLRLYTPDKSQRRCRHWPKRARRLRWLQPKPLSASATPKI